MFTLEAIHPLQVYYKTISCLTRGCAPPDIRQWAASVKWPIRGVGSQKVTGVPQNLCTYFLHGASKGDISKA